jgi:hypothetical protein
MATYCTMADLQNRLSVEGVALRIDDVPLEVLGDVLTDAGTQVEEHCLLRYSPGALAASEWVHQRATDIAVVLLCERRGNPAPASAVRKHDRAMERLEQCRLGQFNVPDVGMAKSNAPVLSTPRIRLDPVPQTVIVKSRSTGNPEGYSQKVDYPDFGDYVI